MAGEGAAGPRGPSIGDPSAEEVGAEAAGSRPFCRGSGAGWSRCHASTEAERGQGAVQSRSLYRGWGVTTVPMHESGGHGSIYFSK